MHQIGRVVGHAFDALRLVGNGTHETEVAEPHVLHRPHDGADIHRILRFVEHDRDPVEARGPAARLGHAQS